MDKNIRECKSSQDIKKTFGVMTQLRNIGDIDQYHQTVERLQKTTNYILYGYFKKDKCLGVVGIQYTERLHTGKIIYIADLVVDKNERSQHIGGILVQFIRELSIKEQCKYIVLDSGVQRHLAHKFYFHQGFIVTSYNFKLINDPLVLSNSAAREQMKLQAQKEFIKPKL